MIANPEHEPALLSALWRAADSLAGLRQRGHKQYKTVEVLVDHVWIAETEPSRWYVLLTRDATRFAKILDQAIVSIETPEPPFNYVRRLRDLISEPTERRLRNFIRDAKAIDKSDMDVIGTGFSNAGRRSGIFPEGLPSDWCERVAAQPNSFVSRR